MQHDHHPHTTPPPAEPAGGKLLATIAVWGTVGLLAAIIGSLGVWALAAIWGAIL